MASDDLHSRIEALNGQPLRNAPTDPDEPAEIRGLRRKLNKRSPDAASTAAGPAAPAPHPPARNRRAPATPACDWDDSGGEITLEEAVRGVITEAPTGPGFYLIQQAASELDCSADEVLRNLCCLTGHPRGEAVERISRVCGRSRLDPEEVLFVDLETTGLSMTPVFLIGTMECVDGMLAFRQYFARDYSEESSILSAFADQLCQSKMIVTFNGKSFDVPFLQHRAIANGLKMPRAQSHLDLLHEARRVYRGALPDCKLQTLEDRVCGRQREDDIPGALIPRAYHEYVRTGNAARIRSILTHNLHDLLTMAELMNRMWRPG